MSGLCRARAPKRTSTGDGRQARMPFASAGVSGTLPQARGPGPERPSIRSQFQGLMIHLEVAVPTPLSRTFTYLTDRPIAAGSRVLVPFGRRRLVGVALGPAKAEAEPGIELKMVDSVI